MHPVNADPRPPSSNLASSDSANALEPPEDADPEAKPAGRGEKAGLESMEDGLALENILARRVEQEKDLRDAEFLLSQGDAQVDQCRCQPGPRPAKPFQKWMKTLHKRVLRQQEMLGYDGSLPPWLHGTGDGDSQPRGSAHHRHSSSDSSFAFVTAAKSASISITGVSLLTRSRKNTIRSSRDPRTECSSRASISGPRVSEDSYCPERQGPVDPAVIERALQRRRILEELISTEEGYIGDVRFLMNVYVTILAFLPTTPAGLRSSVNRNLTDIVELHEEILGELHRLVPDSEYTQLEVPIKRIQSNSSTRGHRRWRSLDAVPEGRDGISWLREVPGMVAEPQTAAEVAKIFLKRMNRFFIYEEYGAKYELMIKDVAAAQRTMPGWSSYQKGLEVLASSLSSAGSRDDQSRRALAIGDLLVKPIQRVCKYPLLFSELLKHTPVIDCPYSHMEIENTLIRLREATAEINRATNDSRTKSVLEKTWILQDRLAFPDQLDAASKNRIRSFGHVRLCGALHVCWQTKDGANGQYMVALLYREWLCLATAGRIDRIYTIQACIALGNIKVEEVDNGRGLQCHTVRHSWKIVFLSDNQLYELILTACSPKEELEWRARLQNSQQAANPDGQDQIQLDIFSFLSLNIKTLGTVFRKPGTIARKISIHRATTIGPKSPLYQVILKNTSAAKEGPASSSNHPINRSQSLLTTNSRIPVLAPARAERARLEALLSDVWTRDVLPFPGITARSRSEHLVRASASSVMRKLSAVGITGSFARRSASLASLQQQKERGGGGGGGEGEVKRRTSEGGFGYTRGLAMVATGDAGACLSPVLSAIADRDRDRDRAERSAPEPDPDPDANRLEMARSSPRRASAPDELGRAMAEMGSCVPSGTEMRTAAAAAAGSEKSGGGSGGSPRPSFQHSNLSEISASAREAEMRMGMGRSAEGNGERNGAGEELDEGQEKGKTSSRSRSLRLSGKKLAKAGSRRREVVVEGIRSLFRQGGC